MIALTEQKSIVLNNTEFHLTITRTPKRRRSTALNFEPPAQLILRAPMHTSPASIEKLMQQWTPWIIKKHHQLKECKPQPAPYQWINGEKIDLLGEILTLDIVESGFSKPQCHIKENQLQIIIPLPPHSAAAKKMIKAAIIDWYRMQAYNFAKHRLDFWCTQLQVQYQKLFISNPQKRWGSCDSKNIIRINWRIMFTPIELADYVLLHELCHVVHKNHSPAFWQLVARFMPDYVERRKTLRQVGLSLPPI